LEVERRQKFGVDYSWLASNDSPVRRPYELPEMKRIELEQMCGRICPSDCGRVLITFRQLIADQETPKAEEIPQLLRATVSQVGTLDASGTDCLCVRVRVCVCCV
jgi:hypothetical protein